MKWFLSIFKTYFKKIMTPLLVVFSFGVLSCSNNNLPVDKSYDDYLNYHLKAEDFFNIESKSYYIYVYQIGCPPCSELRELIFSTLDKKVSNLFLYDASNYKEHDKEKFKEKDKELSIEEMSQSMIGAKSTQELYMLVTPSLYVFNDKTLSKFEYNYYSIERIIFSLNERK